MTTFRPDDQFKPGTNVCDARSRGLERERETHTHTHMNRDSEGCGGCASAQ